MSNDDLTELPDLASERLGGAALLASDDFFAPKENLVKAGEPVFLEHEYTERGKWMDGWESRRKRTPFMLGEPQPAGSPLPHDWCVIKLGVAGVVRGVNVDTRFFRGNYPAACAIEAAEVAGDPDPEALVAAGVDWQEILPRTTLKGDSPNVFRVALARRATHLRLRIYPDGGVARLRVHGEVAPDWARLTRFGGLVDLAAVEHGGWSSRPTTCSSARATT